MAFGHTPGDDLTGRRNWVALRHSDQVLAALLERYTDLTVTDPRRLPRLLAAVRRDGYAVSDRQVTVDRPRRAIMNLGT